MNLFYLRDCLDGAQPLASSSALTEGERGRAGKEEEDSHPGIPGIRMDSGTPRILSLCFSPPSYPSRISPNDLVYISFLYAPPVLVAIFTERSTSPHSRRRQMIQPDPRRCCCSDNLARSPSTRVLHHLLIMDLLYKVCWSGRGNVKVYTQCY